jgi:hypothetical protein
VKKKGLGKIDEGLFRHAAARRELETGNWVIRKKKQQAAK